LTKNNDPLESNLISIAKIGVSQDNRPMITITEKIMSNNLLNIFTVGSFRAVFLKKELEKIHSNQFVISLKNLFRIWNEFNGFFIFIRKAIILFNCAFETSFKEQ
jgi:hypothetical protein